PRRRAARAAGSSSGAHSRRSGGTTAGGRATARRARARRAARPAAGRGRVGRAAPSRAPTPRSGYPGDSHVTVPGLLQNRSAGDGEVVARARAVARAAGRVVAPQALDGVLLAVVARDVVQPARNGRGRRDAEVVPDPRALVGVLVGRVVVPRAEVLAVDSNAPAWPQPQNTM